MENYQTKKYQTTRTLRFGLTATNQSLYSENILDLLGISEKKIENQSKKKSNDDLKIEQLRCCLNKTEEYLKSWNHIYPQIDFLAITKDYYKVLCRKAKFDGFWSKYNKKQNIDIKQPQSNEVKLSSLQSKYNEKKRFQYILDFWSDNLARTENLYRKADDFLKVFEEAKKQNRDDKKLNEVELRKTFLSLFNLINESLKPLVEGNLYVVNDDKIDEQNSDHQLVMDFILKSEEQKQLFDSIFDLHNFFKNNGGYVPFGRSTLNKWTASQKADKRDAEIINIIEALKIDNASNQNVSYDYDKFADNFEQIEKKGRKIWQLKRTAKSVIEICQGFKYKRIPTTVRLSLAARLSKDISFLSDFGVLKSPALDYKKDKERFNLSNYPLKVAFDYAWENCAKAKFEDITFPKEMCEKYLEDVFDVDASTNENFNKYANLLRFKILLGRLKAEYDKTDKGIIKTNIQNLRTIFDKLEYNGDNRLNKKEIKTVVETWFKNKEENIGKKKEDATHLSDKERNDFSLAMQIIGQQRGGLKRKIEKYKTLTEMFKVCASSFGKQFANLRDYFNEEYEVNKIKYRSWIIEDEKQNCFVLFVNKEKEIELASEAGDYKFYEVKSLTSKTLVKLIKNNNSYKDFHSLNDFHYEKIKKDWKNHQNESGFLKALKSALTNSEMAINQKWSGFNFDFSNCDTYEKLEKEIDRKGYELVSKTISDDTLTDLIMNQECYLLPIVNQDINKEEKQARNQFTKDWNSIFEKKKRLHPEFNLFYRLPTKKYPNTKFKNGTEKSKRYSRFQMIAHFGCEVVPQGDYLSKKEQIAIFNDDNKQKGEVKKYNANITAPDYVIGIDRGIKQLATLCILDNKGVIQGDFEIYTRTFNHNSKQWEHSKLENRNILDLSNLRVETTIVIDGKPEKKKVLVDLSSIETKNGENQQKIKLKQLAYIRELQYAMQTRQQELLDLAKNINSIEDITGDKMKTFISPYKEGSQYSDLPKEKIFNLLKEWLNANDNEKRKIAELDPADDLKSGIVANMVGVVAYLCEKYEYKIRIALEDLTRAFGVQKDALNGMAIHQNDEDFKEQENRKLAGVGTYQFFEMQFLKKLFKIGQEEDVLTVPAFRSVDNYEKIVRRDKQNSSDEFVNYPFGIVMFVDPKFTSKRCPICGKINVSRNDNIIKCNNCNKKSGNYQENDKNIHFITNGDENGAYHIALKALKNFNNKEK